MTKFYRLLVGALSIPLFLMGNTAEMEIHCVVPEIVLISVAGSVDLDLVTAAAGNNPLDLGSTEYSVTINDASASNEKLIYVAAEASDVYEFNLNHIIVTLTMQVPGTAASVGNTLILTNPQFAGQNQIAIDGIDQPVNDTKSLVVSGSGSPDNGYAPVPGFYEMSVTFTVADSG